MVKLHKEKLKQFIPVAINFDSYDILLNPDCPVFWNSEEPDHLASKVASWSGSALFVIEYMDLYQQPESSYLIGWKVEVGVARIKVNA